MTQPNDGAYFASGPFVCRRGLSRTESGHETVVVTPHTVCETDGAVGDRARTAQRIACALNAQMAAGG